jgi:hypothetical protein
VNRIAITTALVIAGAAAGLTGRAAAEPQDEATPDEVSADQALPAAEPEPPLQPLPPAPAPAPQLEAAPTEGGSRGVERNFAGSVQLDYMAVPTADEPRRQALDGATVELSMKLAMDFGDKVSANVKLCVACHGVEVGMAFFDLRIAEELNIRVGRFTPGLGEFPLRHDPANHRTSDKPLPYDMGRMLRLREWNMSILPAPWVDNGVELNGTHFFGDSAQVDYALYAISGPRGPDDGFDFDYKQSRSGEAYYVDNNSRPVVGGRLVGTWLGDGWAFHIGASAMGGNYDAANKLRFYLGGVESFVRLGRVTLRGEVLARRTEMYVGEMPEARFRYGPGMDGTYDPWALKTGFYGELEVPVDRFDFVLRGDGLRRQGNVPKTSELRSDSAILRYTAAASVAVAGALRLKLSVERYDFSDFADETVIHTGVAGPF